jgi:hypothetical protein
MPYMRMEHAMCRVKRAIRSGSLAVVWLWSRPQVQVGEDEPEDTAVRRFMKSVVQSGVINKVRRMRMQGRRLRPYRLCGPQPR